MSERATTPAERPTPITDRLFERFQGICLPRPHHCESTAQVSLRTIIENLEWQRDEAREQRDRLAGLLEKSLRYIHGCPHKANCIAALAELEAVKATAGKEGA